MNPIQDYIRESMDKNGFAPMLIPTPEGAWGYSVGFTDLEHPEIVISGLRIDLCAHFLWNLHQLISSGRRFVADEVVDDIANFPVMFKLVTQANLEEFCCQALYWYEGTEKRVQVLQLVFPDKEGRLPWDAGYADQEMQGQRHLWLDEAAPQAATIH